MNRCPRTISVFVAGLSALCCLAAQSSLRGAPEAPTADQLEQAEMEGSELTDAQVHALEQNLAMNPDDAKAHAQLLGYYFMHQYSSRDAVKGHREQALWMIQNNTASEFCATPYCEIDAEIDPEGYAKGRDLWLKAVQRNQKSAIVLSNAANYVMMQDRAQAQSLLVRAANADPDNPKWPRKMAELRLNNLPTSRPADRAHEASLALDDLEKALHLTSGREEKFYLLDELANTAFSAGELDKASAYADRVLMEASQLPHNWNYGNAIYMGNMILGEVALSRGSVASAKRYLLASAKTPGSPQLNSYGPNTTLARDLLAKGERDAVLQYFELCGKFWRMGASKLKEWTATVKSGGTPDWGANLSYSY